MKTIEKIQKLIENNNEKGLTLEVFGEGYAICSGYTLRTGSCNGEDYLECYHPNGDKVFKIFEKQFKTDERKEYFTMDQAVHSDMGILYSYCFVKESYVYGRLCLTIDSLNNVQYAEAIRLYKTAHE